MAKRHIRQKIISGVMAALMLTSSVPIVASAAEAVAYDSASTLSVDSSALDFSASGLGTVYTVDAAELIAKATGASVSAEEAAYLSSLGLTLKYNEGLSKNLISSSTEGNLLILTAKQKTYRANNGVTVYWIPVSVAIDGKTYVFSPIVGGYTASIPSLIEDQLYTATFEYQTVIRVDASTVASLVNQAYRDAKDAIAAQEAYEEAKTQYENANVYYQNALKEYEVLYAEYQTYLQEYKAYSAELAAYTAYCKKVAAYEAALKAYEQYLEDVKTYDDRYAAYEAELDAYEEKQEAYEAYLAYQAQLESTLKKLTTIDTAFVADSAGRTMYATLMGDTVAQVMAQKDTLVNMAGASAADIDNAGAATDILQDLLAAYRKLSSSESRIRWYTDNYTAVRDNFILLYSSLYNLGGNRAVRMKLKQENKWERYAQFVGQLYILGTGLDDSVTFDSSWSFDTFAIYDLIEECQRVVDDNSAAPPDSLPEQMDPVEKPELPTAPEKPVAVSEPVKTWTEEVADPGSGPEKVEEPKKPTLEDFIPTMPQLPSISAALESVVALVRENKLVERSEAVGNMDMTFSASFDSSVSVTTKPVVTFYDHEGKTILYSTRVEQGGTAVYQGVTPTRAANAEYTYTFAGWVDESGRDASLANIQEDTEFYASFTVKFNEYTVVWNVAGERIEKTYRYGITPQYEAPQTYRDAVYEYYFTGWSPAISPVKGDAEYTAKYTATKLDSITYSIRFEVEDEIFYRTFSHGETPVFEEFEQDYVSGGYRYIFTGWSPMPEPATKDAVYTANFEKTYLIPAGESGESSAEMTVTKTTHTVITAETTVEASYAVKEALNAGTQLVLELGGAKLTLSNAILAQMPEAAYFRLTPRTSARTASSAMTWTLSITERDGTPIVLDSEILLELPIEEANANDGKLRAYVNGELVSVTLQEDTAYLRVSETGTITLLPYYSISVSTEGSGTLAAEKESFDAGEQVTLTIRTSKGWKLDTLMISVDGAEETELILEDGKFIMPSGNAVIRAIFEKEEYTVTFVANGVTISTETYYYGDTVQEPNMSDKLVIKEGDITSTFSGWDKTLALVTGDAVYTAVYQQGTVGDKDNTYISDHNSDKLFTVVLPIVLAVLALAAICAVLAWLTFKKKFDWKAFFAKVKVFCVKAWKKICSVSKTAAGKVWQLLCATKPFFSKLWKKICSIKTLFNKKH